MADLSSPPSLFVAASVESAMEERAHMVDLATGIPACHAPAIGLVIWLYAGRQVTAYDSDVVHCDICTGFSE